MADRRGVSPEPMDNLFFHKGMNTRRDGVLIDDGETQSAIGITLANPGIIETLPAREAVSNDLEVILHVVYRHMNWVIAIDTSGNLYYQWDLDGYCNQYVPPPTIVDGAPVNYKAFTLVGSLGSTNRFYALGHKDFIFMADGITNKVFSKGLISDWSLPNPTEAAILDAFGSASRTGAFNGYYTYVIRHSNGEVVESGPSPVSNLESAVAASMLWSNISVCPNVPAGAVAERKLYYYSTSIGTAIHYFDTIANNTATTYTDDKAVSEATINTYPELTTEDAIPFPSGVTAMEVHLNRMFAIKDNKLWWSEPYMPFVTKAANNIEVCPNGEKLISIIEYADTLYYATQKTWYKLSGTDPDTWSNKPTYADVGVVSTFATKKTKFGILHAWYDGVYLFNGVTTKSVTKEKLASTDYWSYTTYGSRTKAAAVAEFDGETYSLYSGDYAQTRRGLNINMKFYPEVAISDDYLSWMSLQFHPISNKYYMVTPINFRTAVVPAYEGKLYYRSPKAADSFTTDLKYLYLLSKAVVGSSPQKRKVAKYLYYDMNTNNKSVTIKIYADAINQLTIMTGGQEVYTTTINTGVRSSTSLRKRGRIQLPDLEGYNFTVAIYNTTDARGIQIFQPWGLQTVLTGD